MEASTGRVLASRGEHERMYPASLTKMATALVALQYLRADEVLVVGGEIWNMPAGFATGLHIEGETITVEMLLNLLLIRSSNETGRVLALNAVRRSTGRANIPYSEAKIMFSVMMNELMADLGATGTNFNNPYGQHSPHHFTTAYDIALLTRAFMDEPLLAQIAGTLHFAGSSLLGQIIAYPVEQHYEFTNTNLMLPGGEHGHPYITGGRTGFTTPAGHCLATMADNGHMRLITVVMGGVEGERWQDTRRLIDYGFANYGFRQIARGGEIVDIARIYNPRLGEDDTVTIFQNAYYSAFMRNEDYAAITRLLVYDAAFAPDTPEAAPPDLLPILFGQSVYLTTILHPPFMYDTRIGVIQYIVRGEVIFEAPLTPGQSVYARSFDSDMDYYLSRFFSTIFTRRALPFWLAGGSMLLAILCLIYAASVQKRLKSYERWQK
jgi:D-alanyl-D-alanine carboxypeptidase (penicillin-binding protein 5/6)